MLPKPPNSPCSTCFMTDQRLCAGFSTVEGTGAIPLLFVAEALGEHELREGLPLRPQAPAGSVFERALRELGYDRSSFSITNVLRGQPRYNKLAGTDYEHRAIRQCLPYLEQTIAETKPKVIVALGDIAFRTLTGMTGKDFKPFKVRGYFVWSERYNCYVLGTFHPSFILRGENQHFPVFKADIRKAIDAANSANSALVIPGRGNYRVVRSAAELDELVREVKGDQSRLIAFDIETGRHSLGVEEDKLLSIMRSDDDFRNVLPAAAGEILEDGAESAEDASSNSGDGSADLDAIFRAYEHSQIESVQFSLAPGTGWFIPYRREFLEGIREILASPNPKAAHNCFHAHTSVWMADGTWKNIRDVDVGDYVYTVKDQQLVAREVTELFHVRDERPWLQVKVDGAYNRGVGRWGTPGVICTPDHEWLTPSGQRVRADQLKANDLVTLPRLGSYDLIFGSLLGDGHVRKDQNILTIGQTNLAYTQAKAIGVNGKIKTYSRRTGFGTGPLYSFTLTVPGFWRDAFYTSTGQRRWQQPPSAAALAIWYGDDGCLSHGQNATFAIHRYMHDPVQVQLIMNWAERNFGPVSIHNDGVLYLHKESSKRLFERIAEWLPDPVDYKLPETFRGRYNNWLAVSVPQLGQVLAIEPYESDVKLNSHKYCLTVDDTHTFFTRGGLVANCWIFDDPILERNGFQINGQIDDTLWMWHHTQPDSPASLQWVASFYGMWGPWKQMAAGEPEVYGCADVDAVQRIMAQLPSDLKSMGLWDSYVKFVRDFHPILRDMQNRGMKIDLDKRDAFQKQEETIVTEFEQRIQGLIPPELQKFKDYTIWPEVLRPLRAEYLAKANIGIAKKKDHFTKFAQIPTELQQELINRAAVEFPAFQWKEFADEIRPCIPIPFNPRSSQQLKDYIRVMAARNPKGGYSIPKSLEGKETTAKKELERLARRTEDVVLRSILELRRHQKVITTYIKGWKVAADSAVHTTFTFAPATWQLSSRGPNIQNAPKHGELAKGFRRCIVPSPGHTLIEADYKSAHALTLGFCAGDTDYMRLARLDCHSFVAAHLLHLPEAVSGKLIEMSDEEMLEYFAWFKSDPQRKFVRDKKAKPTILGYGFGLGKKKLYDMNLESFSSQAEAGKVIEMLDNLFPRTAAFRLDIRKKAHQQKFLISPWGAIRWFQSVFVRNTKYNRLDSGRDSEAAIAFLPANAAFGKVREAMIDLRKEGLDRKYGLNNTVHDSLVFDCPNEYVDEAVHTVKTIMERPASVLTHPTICPDGLVIGVEVSVGDDWASLKEIHI